jgi:hypothetical protein
LIASHAARHRAVCSAVVGIEGECAMVVTYQFFVPVTYNGSKTRLIAFSQAFDMLAIHSGFSRGPASNGGEY